MSLSLSIRQQKYAIITILLSLNTILSVLSIIYSQYWYIFIGILGLASFVNSINVILIIFYNIYNFLYKNIKCINGRTSIESTKIDPSTDPSSNSSINPFSKYIYVLPCYNETEDELRNTIESINKQIKVSKYHKLLVIICDGKIPSGKDKECMKTNEILTEIIFKDYITYSKTFENGYKTWSNDWNDLEVHTGTMHSTKNMNSINFIILIKPYNLGKRDSLTLVRRMSQYYNESKKIKQTEQDKQDYNMIEYYSYFSPELIDFTDNIFDIDNIMYDEIETLPPTSKIPENIITQPIIKIPPPPTSLPPETSPISSISHLSSKEETLHNTVKNNRNVDYIIGTDADTILDTNCSIELIKSIESACNDTVGVVGFVDIVKTWNPLVIYQYCEYLYAQCLKRKAQSIITNKVSCLSGCVQLIRVCNETCGNMILDNFNRLPNKNESILNHIRSYASEDRNHICLMFEMYPYVKTIQTMKAISYTHVPDTIMKFIRQRKRWCAGASSNDLLIVFNNKHNKWERIQSMINVLIFIFTIFVFISTVNFIISIVKYSSLLMLQLATIMLIPALYSLLIPIMIYNDGLSKDNVYKYRLNNKISNTSKQIVKSKLFNIMYYYVGFLIYYIFGSFLNLAVYFNTFYYLDDLNWNSKKIDNGDIDSNNSNNSNNTIVGCEITHTCNCLKWILTYGCSCKYARNANDEYNGNDEYNEKNNKKKLKHNKSFKSININELWEDVEI